MSLVAYGSSDDEDSSEENSQVEQPELTSSKNLSENVKKRPREAVKITIPSLKEFEDEESDAPQKKPKFQPRSGSGLFSLLPPPKNSAPLDKPGFVPHILSKKEQKPPAKKSATQNTPVVNNANALAVKNELDSDDDTSIDAEKNSIDQCASSSNDFFSLDAKPEPVAGNTDEYDDLESNQNANETNCSTMASVNAFSPNNSESFSAGQSIQTNLENVSCPPQFAESSSSDPSTSYNADNSLSESNEPNPVDTLLNDKEFLKLTGGRRREFENIDIIDVNAADQLTDKNEWLVKSLTEENAYRPSRKKHDMPSSVQRRKHQITYLAFQAKEREMDLKNQWANNRLTRRETQAKYGF